jgi:hypothetical protein
MIRARPVSGDQPERHRREDAQHQRNAAPALRPPPARRGFPAHRRSVTRHGQRPCPLAAVQSQPRALTAGRAATLVEAALTRATFARRWRARRGAACRGEPAWTRSRPPSGRARTADKSAWLRGTWSSIDGGERRSSKPAPKWRGDKHSDAGQMTGPDRRRGPDHPSAASATEVTGASYETEVSGSNPDGRAWSMPALRVGFVVRSLTPVSGRWPTRVSGTTCIGNGAGRG